MNLVTGGLVFQSGVTTGSRMRRGLSEEWGRDVFAFKGLLPGERRLGCPRGPSWDRKEDEEEPNGAAKRSLPRKAREAWGELGREEGCGSPGWEDGQGHADTPVCGAPCAVGWAGDTLKWV